MQKDTSYKDAYMDVLRSSVNELCGTICRAYRIGFTNGSSVPVLTNPYIQEHGLSAAPVLIRQQQLLRRNSQKVPRAMGVIWRTSIGAEEVFVAD